MDEMNQCTLTEIESVADVRGGRLCADKYDFYEALKAFEGKTVKWKLELVRPVETISD
jgi:hypothetical protein